MQHKAPAAIRIIHRASGEIIAEGPLGFCGITPFEGNFYISRNCLKTARLKPNWVPGVCVYKFLYVWLDLRLPDGTREPSVGWMYWPPNPLFPFIAVRQPVPQSAPALLGHKTPGGGPRKTPCRPVRNLRHPQLP